MLVDALTVTRACFYMRLSRNLKCQISDRCIFYCFGYDIDSGEPIEEDGVSGDTF